MTQKPVTKTVRQRLSAPYKRIESDIRGKIRLGVWKVGSQIPSRQHLAREYGVDLSTIQKAVSTLLADGVVSSDGTRGTYVSRLPDAPASVAAIAVREEPRRVQVVDPHTTDVEPPRALASALQTQAAKKVIGVAGRFAPEISELLVPYIVAQAVEDALAPNRDIRLSFADAFCDRSHSDPIHASAIKLLEDGVDALCVIYPMDGDMDPIMAAAHRTKTPVVYIPPERLAKPVYQVFVDHCYDGYQAARFFLDMGHRELMFVRLGTHPWALQRFEGARAAVLEAGLPESALRVYPESFNGPQPMLVHEFSAELHQWVTRQIKRGDFRCPVIAANDHLALEIMEAAKSVGVAAGEGFQLIGFDDIPASRRRGLTTLRPPLNDIGAEAARLLSVLLQNGEVRGQSIASAMISQIIVRTTAS
ncbi:MAG TPA: GntR family transcriptional regulator [Capsulimonadaceae bacterium]|jgi:DNA-binding LacI/PurR family transcriptional regulator/DNA-binding transcriptional regulator YhcF (GntR family)